MNTTTATTPDPAEEKLVNVAELLDILWTEQSRPSSRWLRDRTDTGEIPHVRLGGRIFYSVDAVKEALLKRPKFRVSDEFSDSREKKRSDLKHNGEEIRRFRERREFGDSMREQD